MARTISPKALNAARRDFFAHPDTTPRALGKLARAHGLRLRDLRERMEAEGWHLEVRRAAAARRIKANELRLVRGRRQAFRDLAKLTPLLRSEKTDARALRAVAFAAYHAGNTLTEFYSVGAWLAEARRALALAEAGRPTVDRHPWGAGFPKRRSFWTR